MNYTGRTYDTSIARGFKSKYPGTCVIPECKQPFGVGHMIQRYGDKYAHLVCPRKPTYETTAQVEASARHTYDMDAEFAKAERESEIRGFMSDPDYSELVQALNEEEQRFEVEAEVEGYTPQQFANVKAQRVADGTYTLESEDGTHLTIRIQTKGPGSNAAGKVMLSYLNGPDNERSFQGIAWVNEDGPKVWYRFRDVAAKYTAAYNALHDEDARRAAGYKYALLSGRCARCGLTLTVPASIHRGVGPTCAGKDGW